MKLKTNELKTSLSAVAMGVKKSSDFIQLTFSGTKLQVSSISPTLRIFRAIEVISNNEEPFNVNVNSGLLINVVSRFLSDELNMERRGNFLFIKNTQDNNFSEISLGINEDCIDPDTMSDESLFSGTFCTSSLQKYTSGCIHAIEASSKEVKCASFHLEEANDKIRLTATDGKRIAVRDELGNQEKVNNSVIVFAKDLYDAVKLIPRDKETTIRISKNVIRISDSKDFKDEEIVVILSISTEQYFTQLGKAFALMNTNNAIVTVSTQALVNACEMASLFGQDIALTVSENKLAIACKGLNNKVENELSVSTKIASNTSVTFGFHAKFLIDALKSMDTSIVELKFGDIKTPVLITSPDDDSIKEVVFPKLLKA